MGTVMCNNVMCNSRSRECLKKKKHGKVIYNKTGKKYYFIFERFAFKQCQHLNLDRSQCSQERWTAP